jgi:hypothetical protein
MNPATLQCTKCRTPLSDPTQYLAALAPCPSCAAALQMEIFPALFRQFTPGRGGDRLLTEDEASCFYHPQKRASVPCDACGRFLCGLCDCELNGQHLCPVCLEAGGRKGKIKNLQTSRTLYDSIALALAVYPVALIFGIYFTPITAPMALYVAVRHWNAPRSLVRRTRARSIAAIILAMMELGLVVLFIYFLAHGNRARS